MRQNSACSDFKPPSYTESGLEKKRVGCGGGGGERVDPGKADIATRFPSVCKNMKPKTVSAGKNVNHKGPRKPGSQHSLTCTPRHRQISFWVRWGNGTKCRKDTELGQGGFCRGGVVNGLVPSPRQGWDTAATQRRPPASPRICPRMSSSH